VVKDGMLISGKFCGLKYLSLNGLQEIESDEWVKEMVHKDGITCIRTESGISKLALEI
jgi:hypothetical protein